MTTETPLPAQAGPAAPTSFAVAEALGAAQALPRVFVCVYIFRDASGDVLYVGQTRHWAARLKVHACRAPWFGAAVSVELLPTYEARDDRLRHELRVIEIHQPSYNIQGAERGRALRRERLADVRMERRRLKAFEADVRERFAVRVADVAPIGYVAHFCGLPISLVYEAVLAGAIPVIFQGGRLMCSTHDVVALWEAAGKPRGHRWRTAA